MQNKIKNIDETTWFSKMKNYPDTIMHIKILIEQVDLLQIFKKYDLEKIKDLSTNQLDYLYILLRISHKLGIRYCELMTDEILNYVFFNILKEIEKEEFTNQIPNIAFDEIYDRFCADISDFFVNFLNRYVFRRQNFDMQKNINFTTKYTINFLTNLFEEDDYRHFFSDDLSGNIFLKYPLYFDKMSEYLINLTEVTIIDHYEKLITFVEKLNNSVIENLLISLNFNYDVGLLMKDKLYGFEYCSILFADKSKIFIEDDLITISNFENYYKNTNKRILIKENIRDLLEFDIEIYEHPKYTESLNKEGYTIYQKIPENDLLSIFIHHNFFTSDTKNQLLDLIIDIMVNNKYQVGIIDIDDVTNTLLDSYELFAMSENINMHYDEFIIYLQNTHTLPSFYPEEYMLRLISRILSVNIEYLYQDKISNNFITIIMNNVDEQLFDNSIIISRDYFNFYILHKNNEEFIPVNFDNKYTGSNMNKTISLINIRETIEI
uniref:Uncharacterized protein n=1 Tax=viral metagenome TaxID=1070528 RepID=A0A6C0LUK2_9ZZZZ